MCNIELHVFVGETQMFFITARFLYNGMLEQNFCIVAACTLPISTKRRDQRPCT